MYNEINEFLYPFFQIGFLLCVAFLVIWNRILILRVVKLRREKKISLESGGDEELARAIRCHGNFIESVSIAVIIPIILFFEKEFVIFSFLALVLLCIGRYTHSEGLKNVDEDIQYRRRGMYFSRYSNYVSLVGVAFYIAHIVMSF
ncbi:MAG: MAPEG family protein [Pseudomonadota bacterium]|nr:MAPEG family protein [Pseudomonadota bacterium]